MGKCQNVRNGVILVGFVLMLMMAGATVFGGIGALGEYFGGDLGFQEHYIAENQWPEDTNVKEVLGDEYEKLRQVYWSGLSPLDVVKQMVVGNAAMNAMIAGGAIGLIGGIVAITCTGGYLDEKGWTLTRSQIDEYKRKNEKVVFRTKDGLGDVNLDEFDPYRNYGSQLPFNNKPIDQKTTENAHEITRKMMGASLMNKHMAWISFVFVLLMMCFGGLTYSGTIDVSAGLAVLASIGMSGIVIGLIGLCGVGCVMGCCASRSHRRLESVVPFGTHGTPRSLEILSIILLLLTLTMMVSYHCRKRKAQSKSTKVCLEQVVVKQ